MSFVGMRSEETPTNSEGYPIVKHGECGAMFFWAETLAGKRLRINAEPTPDGDLAMEERDTQGQRLIAHRYEGANLAAMRGRGFKMYAEHSCGGAA